MLTLQIITVSTRQGRQGPFVATWFAERARAHGRFAIETIDLAEVNLPMLDEPRHPRMKQYEHEHTKRWSAVIDRADAYVFVTPEYNHGSPPSLVNALDYLLQEWAYKPAAFVSYGGLSGGTRSVQMSKQIVVGLKMMPIYEAVNIPFFTQYIDAAAGRFNATDRHELAADEMLDELEKWAIALKTMRPQSA